MLTLCRLCLSKDANFVITNGQVAARIITCTGLEFETDDGLPQLICETCRLRLEEFSHFRKRCHAADRRLRYLKSTDGNVDPKTRQFLECGTEDAIYLQDVAHCTATMCSESNAQWRREAAQLIRSELDTYKKQLLGLCKQQVREEIEQEVRSEVEGLLVAQAQKECRVKVLDDLFYELETFFIEKRDEATLEAYGSEGFVSDSETIELESVSPSIDQGFCPNENDTIVEENTESVTADGTIILDPIEEEPMCTIPTPAVPIPMVEINMENTQLGHLRDDSQFTRFLTNKTTAPATPSIPDVQKTVAPISSKISPSSSSKTSQGKMSFGRGRKKSEPKHNSFRYHRRGSKNMSDSLSK